MWWRHYSTFSLRRMGWIYLYSFISLPPPQLHVDTKHTEQNNLNTKYIAGGLTELLLEAAKKANKTLLFSIKFLYSLKPLCHYIKINAYPCLRTICSALIKLSLIHSFKYLGYRDENTSLWLQVICEAPTAWKKGIRSFGHTKGGFTYYS